MTEVLRELLGANAALPRRGELLTAEVQRQDGLMHGTRGVSERRFDRGASLGDSAGEPHGRTTASGDYSGRAR